MKKLKLLPLLALAIPFIAGCGGHTHNYELHDEVPSTCSSEGTEAYYTCSGCDKLFNTNKEEISQPIAIEKDPNNHSGTKVLAITDGYEKTYVVGDTFDIGTAKLKFKCENCEGVEIAEALAETATITYPTKDATCFTSEDASKGSVEVGINLATGGTTFTTKVNVTVGKKVNVITGLEDLDVHCGYSITEFDEMLEDGTIFATSGEDVTLAFSEDGTNWKARTEYEDTYVFNVKEGESSTYYVKASSEATDEFVKPADAIAEIRVTHQPNEWNKDGKEYDYIGCLCKPDEVTKYFKQVNSTVNNKIVLSNDSSILSLDGTSYLKDPFTADTIDSITLITEEGDDIELGTSLTISSSTLSQHPEIYGPQTIVVTINQKEISGEPTIPATTHEIILDVTVVTAQIASKTDWENNLYITQDNQVVSGYFEITQDITEALPSPAWRQGWDWASTKFEGTIEGNNHSVVSGQGVYGLFPVMDHATIRNLTFKNNWWRRTATQYYLLANKCLDSEINNCTFEITGYDQTQKDTPYEPEQNYGYLFGNGGAQRDVFIDCFFDFASPVSFDLPCLLSHSTNNTKSNTFENCTLTCKSITEIALTNEGAITEDPGLTIITSREETWDQIEVLASSTDPISITIHSEYSGYTVTSKKFVSGTDSYDIDDLASFNLPEAVKTDSTKHGENKVVIKLETETDKVVVTVPVLVVTAEIANKTDWGNNLKITKTGQEIYGYYKLTADITDALDAPAYISSWDTCKFKGTLDGNGHSIIFSGGPYGLFYVMDHATINNLTFKNNWWRRTEINYHLLANKSLDSVISGCDFEITGYKAEEKDTEFDPITNYGYLFGNAGAQRNAFIDCNFDFTGFKLPCLLSHSTNNTKTNTFENCNLHCIEVTEIANTNQGVITEAEGLTIYTDREETMSQIEVLATSTDPISIALDPKYEDYDITSSAFVHGTDSYPIDDIASFALPDAIKDDNTKHGENNSVVIKLESATDKVTITVPMLVVTQYIEDFDDFKAIFNAPATNAASDVYGYYKLKLAEGTTELDVSPIKEGRAYNNFYGTFDGDGKILKSQTMQYGCFGILKNATLKNFTIKDVWSKGGTEQNTALLSLDMQNTKLIDVDCVATAYSTSVTGLIPQEQFPINIQSYGWINCRVCQNCVFTNCTFDAGTTTENKRVVQTLLGTHQSCVNNTFANCTMTCDSYYCLYQSNYQGGKVTTAQDGIIITGECVYQPSQI